MSYDISMSMNVDTGGANPYHIELYDRNVTYNLADMFYLALGEGGIRGLSGKKGGDVIDKLNRAVEHITDEDNLEAYEALNPKNGWGDHDGAISVLTSLRDACVAHPLATIDVR